VLGSDAKFLAAAGGATLAIAVLGLALWRSDGLPGRLDEIDAKLIETDDRLQRDAEACANRTVDEIAAGSLCELGSGSGTSALVWGDSHALALLPAYEQIALQRGVRISLAVRSACRPLLDAASRAEPLVRREVCDDFNRATLGAIDALDPNLVILNAYWTFPDLSITATRPADSTAGSPPFEDALERTLRAIGPGPRVCVVGGIPTLDYHTAHAYWMARRRGLDTAFLAPTSTEAARRHAELDGYFAGLRASHALTFVEPKNALCPGSTCTLLTSDGRPVYRDDNHLSQAGALLLVDSLEACFDAGR
jgi:hypothetical protein